MEPGAGASGRWRHPRAATTDSARLGCWLAAAMHAAFGLRATLMFDLAAGEYHTNVVMSVLAGRGLVICPDGFADPVVAEAIAALYEPTVLRLDAGF